jgi:hypothetical protein
MNVYQDWRTLRWIREMKFADGHWYRCGEYGTYNDAWLAPIPLRMPWAIRIDGPTR